MLTRPRLTAAARPTPAAVTRKWRARLTLFLLAAALALFASGGAAAAAPLGQINEFSAGLNSGRILQLIAPGADGNLWFTDQGSTPAIGRITPSGAIHEFSTGAGTGPYGIAPGPDGNVWFADGAGAIGRITPSGTITEFSSGLPAGSIPQGIAPGPDGNLWFTDPGAKAIGRITPSGVINEFSNGLNPNPNPQLIAPGADGNLWFVDDGTTRAIGRITPSGVITEFDNTNGLNANSTPFFIAPGPDGNVWFTDLGTTRAIGRITPTGTITEFPNPGSAPSAIAAGADGNVWFADNAGGIGRITPWGDITEFSIASSQPFGIASGADGSLWFTDQAGTQIIGRIGTGSPAASQALPQVVGSGQAGTRQSCLGDRWADWAGVPPSSSPFAFAGFDGYQWLLDGKPLLGKTGRSYTPTQAQAGHLLSCRLTVTYPLPLLVTTSATSPAVRVLAGPPKPPPPSLPCVVPNVIGKKLATAKAAITDAHCKVGKVKKKKSSAKPGRVLSQKPGAGAVRSAGSKVALVVSKH